MGFSVGFTDLAEVLGVDQSLRLFDLLGRGFGSVEDRKLIGLLPVLFEGVKRLECFKREWFSYDDCLDGF